MSQLKFLGTISALLCNTLTHQYALALSADPVNQCDSKYHETMHQDFLRRQLLELNVANPLTQADFDNNKHIPFIVPSADNTTATVTVGDGDIEGGVYHPSVPSDDPKMVHFVSHIYVVDQDGKIIGMRTMDPNTSIGGAVETIFHVPTGVTSLTAYEWCNLHGLWKGPTIQIKGAGEKKCIADDTDAVPPDSISTVADFKRRQRMAPFSLDRPYTVEDNGVKHIPYIYTSNDFRSGTVKVGKDGIFHPMVPSNGTTLPHWITEVWVEDQEGNIITFVSLDPTFVDIAEVKFAIPDGVTSLTGHEWCNLHGWHISPTVTKEALLSSTENKKQPPSPSSDPDTSSSSMMKVTEVMHLLTFVSVMNIFM